MMMNVISNTLNDYRVSNIGKIVNGFSYRITDNGVLSINGDCISNQNIIDQQVSSKKTRFNQTSFLLNCTYPFSNPENSASLIYYQ